MGMKPLISVIIPVYKVEKFLPRCIDSVMKQTYTNLEIVLIDDGSPDQCGELCESYAKKDKRICVIHKENGGLSDARNVALDMIHGEYVCFIDSDDFVTIHYIENLYNAIKKTQADMSCSSFINYFENDSILQKTSNEIEDTLVTYTSEQCLEKMLYQDKIETVAWGKLYDATLFKDIRYPKGKLYEDVCVTYKLIHRANKIVVFDNKDYYYYQREDSIQYKKFTLAKMDAIWHMRELVEFVEKEYPMLQQAAICRYFSAVCNILFQIPEKEYDEQRIMLWNEVKRNRKMVLTNSQGRKKARAAALLSFLGYHIMSLIYRKTQFRGTKKK